MRGNAWVYVVTLWFYNIILKVIILKSGENNVY